MAKALNGKRIPTSGSAQFPGEEGDVLHTDYEIECKWRTKISGNEIIVWMLEVTKRAFRSKKIPLLAIHKRGGTDYVMLRLKDFKKMYDMSFGQTYTTGWD